MSRMPLKAKGIFLMAPLIYALPGNEYLAGAFSEAIGAAIGKWTQRRFPDGEFYARIETLPGEDPVLLFSSWNDPDAKFLPLLFLSSTLRDLGAKRIILVAPYLAYLRQDTRFREGEGVTSRYFAAQLSGFLDGIVTVDPHLHRYASLGEIYSIPTKAVQAAPTISEWIRANVSHPLIIGPDSESEQWVNRVAKEAGAPFLVLEKVRKGDRDVEIRFPALGSWQDRTPVIVDDIISSGRTMLATVDHLLKSDFSAPVCVGVHGIFTGNCYAELLTGGAGKVVTCNTIPHPSNEIDLSRLLAKEVKDFLAAY